MNPLTNMRNVKKLSEQELQRLPKSSWHDEYKSSAWIFVGGLPYDLSEGDMMSIFSQYGEITNLNLVRDKDTGKQKGFCFICYEDQRSTILAVDNFNGTRVLGRILRVDHVKDYKPPKNSEPTNKIKTEKLDDDDFQVKTELKTEIKEETYSPQFQRTIRSPEIKREVCTPEVKREICTPEIIGSPNSERNKKKKKKNKDKKRHHNDQREGSREKYRKKYDKSEQDKREKSNKRFRHSQSQEKNVSNDFKTRSFKEHGNREDRKLKDDRKEYNKDYDRNKRKNQQKDDKSYKKIKKV